MAIKRREDARFMTHSSRMRAFLWLYVGLGRTEDEIQCNQNKEQCDALQGAEGNVADIPAAQIIEYESQRIPQDGLEHYCKQAPFTAAHFPIGSCHGTV